LILAPVVRGQKGEHVELLEDLRRRGYVRARIDGKVVHLDQAPALGRHNRHDIEVVIDRLVIDTEVRPRLAEAVENALALGDGTVIVAPAESATSELCRALRAAWPVICFCPPSTLASSAESLRDASPQLLAQHADRMC
jgi:excinuclease ABC subunit A